MIKILFSIFVLVFMSACDDKSKKISENQTSNKTQNIKIGVYKGEASLLLFIAKEYGFFDKEALNPEFVYYKTGRDAFKAMLDNKVDYSDATEYVAIKNYFNNEDFKILASISHANINGMITKKSTSINSGFDLKNKIIGTTIGTATEFYTGVFLQQYGLNLKDVNLVNVPPKNRIETFTNDKVDALFAWEPHIYKIKEKFQNNTNYFTMPLGFNFDFIFAASKNFHQKNLNTSKKILKALISAENYLNLNPNIKNDIMKKYLNRDDKYIQYIKDKYSFQVHLSYPMLVNMDNQKSYLLKNNLVKNKDFKTTDLIDIKTLGDIDTTKVSIWEQ